jgi:hypothetical protein
MRPPEARPFFAGFIQDANQVDDHINPAELLTQDVGVMHIGFHQRNVRIDDQCTMAFSPACQHAYLVAVLRQPVCQVLAYKTGATGYTDCFMAHLLSP